MEDSDEDWTLSMVESNPATIVGNAPDLMIATAACSESDMCQTQGRYF